MKYLAALLLALLAYNTTSYAESRTKMQIGVVCFGVPMDCPRSVSTAFRAVDILKPQLPEIDMHISSVRPVDLPEATHPLMEINLFMDVAERIAREYRITPDVLMYISPNQTDNVLGIAPLGQYKHFAGVPLVAHLVPDPQLSADVVAHELCHILGAGHSDKGLMTPSLRDPKHSRKLSPVSLFEIRYFLAGLSSSLSH